MKIDKIIIRDQFNIMIDLTIKILKILKKLKIGKFIVVKK